MTIKQLLDLEEAYPGADFQIDGHPVTQVTLVGQVRAVNPQQTNITYRLDDSTGTIDVKKWVDSEKADDADPKYQLDQWVRVWGRLRSFNGKRHVGGHFFRAIDNYDEVNYHLLEANYVHLYYTKGPLGGEGGQMGGDANAGAGDSMFVDQVGDSNGGGSHNGEVAVKLSSCGPQARRVFQFLQNSPGNNEGVHLNLITKGTDLSSRDVLQAADELLAQGLVYTTVDDETWAVLDY